MSGSSDEASQPQSFSDIAGRLDEIVKQVRDKNVSLEKSLDLFDEAIALGSKAIDMVDTAEATGEEKAAAQKAQDGNGTSPVEAPHQDEAPDGQKEH